MGAVARVRPAPLGFRRLGPVRVSKLSGFGFEPGIYTVACPAPVSLGRRSFDRQLRLRGLVATHLTPGDLPGGEREREQVKKIYVGNLPWGASEADLRDFFSTVGEVHSVAVITDRET